jgi:hypothetical protein
VDQRLNAVRHSTPDRIGHQMILLIELAGNLSAICFCMRTVSGILSIINCSPQSESGVCAGSESPRRIRERKRERSLNVPPALNAETERGTRDD